ncbi:MAG TPA: F0F1 ATP synthase subunit B [Coriobacteriia bacterium]|jgi:F-type H+-transporting ATPase subunit b
MDKIIPLSSEVLVALVSFGVLFIVMWKFALPPITKMLDERAEKIKDSLEKAEETRVEAERLLDEYKEQLAEARQEANRVIEQGRKVADTMKDEIVAKANEERESMLVRAREEIQGEKRAAMAELQAQVADLSVAVAGRLIGSTLSADDHRALIEKVVAEVGSLDAE